MPSNPQQDSVAAVVANAPHCPAAFINVIADKATKTEVVEWLQKIWNERMALERECRRLAAAQPAQVITTTPIPDEPVYANVPPSDGPIVINSPRYFPAQPAAGAGERERFEKWWENLMLQRNLVGQPTPTAWLAWQAALQARPQAGEVERGGYCAIHGAYLSAIVCPRCAPAPSAEK